MSFFPLIRLFFPSCFHNCISHLTWNVQFLSLYMQKEYKVKPLNTEEYNFFSFDILYKIKLWLKKKWDWKIKFFFLSICIQYINNNLHIFCLVYFCFEGGVYLKEWLSIVIINKSKALVVKVHSCMLIQSSHSLTSWSCNPFYSLMSWLR